MRRFLVLWIKEEKALFSSPIAYVLIAVFLLIMGYSFTLALFISHAMSLTHLFFQMFVLLLLTVPIITMRLIAEERKLADDRDPAHLAGDGDAGHSGKVRGQHEPHPVMLLLSGAYAIVLGIYGYPDWGPIFSGYLGLVLLAAALVGVGLLTSTLTSNQIIAALLSLSTFLLLWIIDEYGYLLPDPFDSLVVNLSLSVHFKPFATGSMYLSDAAFYLSAAMLSLFLSVRALAWR